MPKKNPKNAFSFYLDDAIIELRQDGIYVKNKGEAVSYVHEKWKNMSAAEKAPYEEKAREWKLRKNNNPRSGRLDCTGNLIDNRVDMDQVIQDQRKQQRMYLINQWQSKSKQQMLDQPFFLMSFQSFFEFPNEEGYQPCEVACVQFSFRKGIMREFHAMINPGPIKLGLGAESKIFSDRTHKIPIYGFEPARRDYLALWNELLEFLNPGMKLRVYPPIFTKLAELDKTSFCVDYMAQLAGVANRLSKIYQWEGLVSTLYVHASVHSPSLNIIAEGAASTMYDYEGNTKCDYHDELECIYCALLTIKKCCFWMSDAFSEIYDYEVTDSHLPTRRPAQYTIVHPEEMTTSVAKKKFLGASSHNRHDPNLPPNYQPNKITSGYSSDASYASSSFASRDIRYRPRFKLVENRLPMGRGTTIITRSEEAYDTQSNTDTNDDVTSSILSDTESDVTCNADDEMSVTSHASHLFRRPRTKPPIVQQLSGKYNFNLPDEGNNSDKSQASSIDLTDSTGESNNEEVQSKKNDQKDNVDASVVNTASHLQNAFTTGYYSDAGLAGGSCRATDQSNAMFHSYNVQNISKGYYTDTDSVNTLHRTNTGYNTDLTVTANHSGQAHKLASTTAYGVHCEDSLTDATAHTHTASDMANTSNISAPRDIPPLITCVANNSPTNSNKANSADVVNNMRSLQLTDQQPISPKFHGRGRFLQSKNILVHGRGRFLGVGRGRAPFPNDQ